MKYAASVGIAIIVGVIASGLVSHAQQPTNPARGATPGGAAARGGAVPRSVAAAGPTGPKAVGSVRDIMRAMTVPSSDAVFGAGAETPTTAAAWEQLRLNAMELAESGNLLMIGARVRDRGDWMRMARAQVDAAEAVMRIAALRQSATLSEASDKAYETCTTCHNKYWTDRNKAE